MLDTVQMPGRHPVRVDRSRDALLTAFMTGSLFVVLPMLGGAFGYWLGAAILREGVISIVEWAGLSHGFAKASVLYQKYDVMVVGAAAFTVIPYKVFTILAGLFDLDFPRFVIASLLGRGGRFILVAGGIYFLGPRIKPFVEKYLELLTLAIAALVVLGFLSLKLISHDPLPVTPEEVAVHIVALEDPDEAVRKEAIRFLWERTEGFFGFNPTGPDDERAAAVKRWVEWFEQAHPGVPLTGSGTPGEGTEPPDGETGAIDGRIEEAPPLDELDRQESTIKMGEDAR